MKHFTPTHIYLGNQFELETVPKDWTKVHIGTKFYPKSITEVLHRLPDELFVNWQDSSDPSHFAVTDMLKVISFMHQNNSKSLFIHCEYAQSRSPAVVMAYLAKYTTILPKNFLLAIDTFSQLYPSFVYPTGITQFLRNNWEQILGFDTI
jgi:protein-tyrosine phosphatase